MNTNSIRKIIDLIESVNRPQLNEDFGLDFLLDKLSDSFNDPIRIVYNTKEEILQKFLDNKHSYTPLKSARLPTSGPGAKWVRNTYEVNVQDTLYRIVKSDPKNTQEIKNFLSSQAETGLVSFSKIEQTLIPILRKYAAKVNHRYLARILDQAVSMRNQYNAFEAQASEENEKNFAGVEKGDKRADGTLLGRVTDRNAFKSSARNDDTTYYSSLGQGYTPDEETDIAQHRQADNARKQLSGQQGSAAEDMVNAILGSLPPRIAGDIRNAISRSPNRLQALQRELTARGIK